MSVEQIVFSLATPWLVHYHWIANRRGVISLQKYMLKLDIVDYMSQNPLHPVRSGEEGF